MKIFTKLAALICLALLIACSASAETAHDCSKDGHKLSEPLSVREATCSQEGYTGDIYCAFCGAKVVTGTAIPALAHTPGELSDVREATCSCEGYTGDIRCTACRTVLTQGSPVAKLAHTPGSRQGAEEPTCSWQGYTGDVFCTVCYELIEYGQSIPMLPHTPGAAQNVMKATCTQEGYTGDIYCTVCGALVTMGESVEMLEHVPGELRDVVAVTCSYPGYTGDTECLECGRTLYGEPVEKMTHSFDGDQCVNCGWLTPGVYLEGQMVFTWDQLVEAGYITVKDGEIREVQEGLTGLLVIQEGLNMRTECCKNGSLTGVYIPASVKNIYSGMFKRSEQLVEVRCFGYMNFIGDNAFLNCSSLRSFVSPLGVTEIRGKAFGNCTALETVVLSDTLELIEDNAFSGCAALTDIALPESLRTIGNNAFENCASLRSIELNEGLDTIGSNFLTGSAVSALTLPSTVTYMYAQDNDALISVDMSASAITNMGGSAFKGSENLLEVILPECVEEMPYSSFAKCVRLRRLVMPEGLKEISDRGDGTLKACTDLTELVWPVSLLDGSELKTIPNLRTIYYRGTELQWNMTNTKDDYAGVKIVFEYTGD